MKVKGIKKVASIMLSLLLVGMLMPVMHVKADGYIEINETNFPDANFRIFINETYARNPGFLNTDDIATVTTMYCNNKNISNLKGIEKFTALVRLECFNNQLTSLDVSQNTALEELNCGSNQLTSLDVSHNTALKHLECYSNNLTALDVTPNTKLEYLDCSSNPLTSLKVYFGSGLGTATVSNGGYGTFDCTGIDFTNKTLTIADPTLTSTDPAYTFKEWSVTYADTTTPVTGSTTFTVNSATATITAVWKVVDINATTFPDPNFRNFISSKYDNVLTSNEIAGATSMDCSSQNISNLKGIEYFTALTVLTCSNNNLGSLDVSKNVALERLHCSTNQLTSLDVSSNTALKYLLCFTNNLTSLDVSSNTALIQLECTDNQITALDVSGNTALEYLYCSSNQLTSLIVPFGTVTATVSNGGHGTFECTGVSISGKTLTIADPTPTSTDQGYTFKEWNITGATQTDATGGGKKFTVDDTAATITAVWDHELTLTIKEIYQNANGSIERTVTTTETATDGETKTVTKTAPSGYTIVGESTQTVTMDSDKTITFTYRKKGGSSGGGGGYVPPAHRVTYTDGVEDIVFEDETYYVSAGRKTPDFKGKTEREGYTFKGWSPEVTKTVTRSVTYTAIWEENDPKKPDPDEPDPLKPVPVKIYRLYNPGGYHFFTSDINERDYLIYLGWVDEGTGFISTDKALIPVYRVYNPNNGDHFFTVDLDEAVQLKSFGWIFEGIGFYSFEEGVPVYRLYNPNSGGEHFYTMDIAERDALIELGWCDEGVAFYMTDGL